MINAYTKVPSPQLLDDCPRILAASQRLSSWLHHMDLDDYFEDNTGVDQMDDKISTFLRTLDAIGKRPSSSKLTKYAVELFDAAHAMSNAIAVFDAYVEDHPHLPQDAYQVDRDAFLQSLAKF